MIQSTEKQYFEARDLLINANGVIKEHFNGSRKTIYVDRFENLSLLKKHNIEIGGITTKEFRLFLARFNKELFKSIRNNPELMMRDIVYNKRSRDKNQKIWDDMNVGDIYPNIDLKSAYWQMLYRLGYIGEKLYQKYMFDNRYKQAKRLCVSFLGRDNYMRYSYSDGGSNVIVCDNTVLERVYVNVRNELYSCINIALKGVKPWIEYNIDGISVPMEQGYRIMKKFDSLNLVYETKIREKVSETEYLCDGRRRKFCRSIDLSGSRETDFNNRN